MVTALSTATLLALTLLTVDAFKLTFDANAKLQETCGHDMREVQKYDRKVLNGTAAKGGESPWTAAVFIVDHEGNTVYTTGTIISRRHILTYDQLVVMNTTDGLRLRHDRRKALGDQDHTCEGHDMVLPKEAVRRVSVYLDMLRVDRFESKRMMQLRKITILGGCQTPYNLNKVTVLELTRDILDQELSKPICLTPDNTNSSFTFYGYGDNRGEVMDATLRRTTISIVPCNEPVADDIFCVKSQQPLCNGDFGGGAVHRQNQKVINAYGIYVDGPYECATADANTIYKFANLTKSSIRASICGATGVCDPTQIPISTTPKINDDTEAVTTRRPSPSSDGTSVNGTIGAPTGNDGTSDAGSVDGTCTKGVKNYGVCSDVNDDGDIHIHIKLGKFRKTKNPEDIEVVRSVNGHGKRGIR